MMTTTRFRLSLIFEQSELDIRGEKVEGSITLAEIPNVCSHGKFKMNEEERKAAA